MCFAIPFLIFLFDVICSKFFPHALAAAMFPYRCLSGGNSDRRKFERPKHFTIYDFYEFTILSMCVDVRRDTVLIFLLLRCHLF